MGKQSTRMTAIDTVVSDEEVSAFARNMNVSDLTDDELRSLFMGVGLSKEDAEIAVQYSSMGVASAFNMCKAVASVFLAQMRTQFNLDYLIVNGLNYIRSGVSILNRSTSTITLAVQYMLGRNIISSEVPDKWAELLHGELDKLKEVRA